MNRRYVLALVIMLTWPSIAAAQDSAADERANALLKQYPEADANRDGKLTRDEWRAFRAKLREKQRNPAATRTESPKSPMKRYRAEDMSKAYEARQFQDMPYRLLKPPVDAKSSDRKFPLILSLHGAGGKGDDNLKNLKIWNGVLMEREFQQKHPCFVVAPQSQVAWRVPGSVPKLNEEQIARFPQSWRDFAAGRSGFTRDESEAVLQKVFDLLDALAKELPIDTDRVYVLGHSMGGFGTFESLAMQPKRFAAAIPSAGGLSPWLSPSRFTHVPIWAFHGNDDRTVPIGLSRHVFEEMKKAGGNMKFTSLARVGHGANAFAFIYTGDDMADGFVTHYSSKLCDKSPDVWEWLFAQKLQQP